MTGDTYYTLLDVPIDATLQEITAAYQRQRDRYGLERVTMLGDDFRQIAAARLANLEQAYAELSDLQRREDYDRRIGVSRATTDQASRRPGLSRREQALAIGGALASLLLIALVWMLTGRSVDGGLVPVGETAKPAPEFALPGLNGGTVRLSDYRGKIVLVNFWGTWCEPCKEETPALQAAYQQLRDQGLMIIGVDLRKQERPGPAGDADVRAFAERFGVTYPVALDVDGETARAYQVLPLPTSYIVDQTGTIRFVRVGIIKAEEIEALFTRLRQSAAALRRP